MPSFPANAEQIHPGLWRASQLARGVGRTVATGYDVLTGELPGGGWPVGTMIELLPQHAGVGELRLLAPALAGTGQRAIVLIDPPQIPNAAGLAYVGLSAERLVWLRPRSSADALWSAEQVLRAGTCSALIFWQNHIRPESLRRLQVAAKAGETLFFMVRPLTQAVDPSPAELRLALRPTDEGLTVEIVKRRGPAAARPVLISLRPSAKLISSHGRVRRNTREPVYQPLEADVLEG
nr:translesion DNA synthesis-associated protein ImuA [Paraburkholderia sp. C35]